MMSAERIDDHDDRRHGDERRRQQWDEARQNRWKDSTPESRRSFMKKVAQARKPASEVKRSVVSISLDAGDHDWCIQRAAKARVPVRTFIRRCVKAVRAAQERAEEQHLP